MSRFHIDQLAYTSGWKYQVRLHKCTCSSQIKLEEDIDTRFYRISKDGLLTAKVGCPWNGADKPAINTKSFVRGSLFHDIVRRAIAEGLLDPEWCAEGDCLMRRITKRDHMMRVRR